MKKLDFISGAPKTFIFQQDSNKTNLGGLLTILFILAMLIIIYSYIYEYFANDKYNVSYSYNEVYYESKELDKIYSNEKLYPEINYNIDLGYFGQQEEKIKDLIVLDSNRKEISFGENRKTKVSELSFAVYYKCKNGTYCVSEDGNDDLNLYLFILEYYGYFCDHQNPESPIKRDKTYKIFPFTIEDRIDYYLFDWKIIKYEEESSFSGMFRSTKETYGGVFTGAERYSIPPEGIEKYKKMNNETGKMEYYKMMAGFDFYRNNFGYYDNYSREKVSIFDAIANICALVSTLYGVVTFIFCGFYSNSFDNYKIIEKIISRGAYLDIKDIKDIREDSPKDRPKEQIELKDQIETDIKDNLIEVKEDSDDKKMLDDDKEKKEDLKPLFRIPKFHFYDFLYNNVYFDCCKPSTTQGVISACNDLISKYYSIDAVIYNQLRLENLFRDYKWNNPQLNSIGNNDILSQIKALSDNLTGN
jgi:hypothetical protein